MVDPTIEYLWLASGMVIMLSWTAWTLAVREETTKGIAGVLMTAGLLLYLAIRVVRMSGTVELLATVGGTVFGLAGAGLLLWTTFGGAAEREQESESDPESE